MQLKTTEFIADAFYLRNLRIIYKNIKKNGVLLSKISEKWRFNSIVSYNRL